MQVKEFLKTTGLKALTWPGNSPDLNPIENCWQVVGRRLAERKPVNKQELQEAIIHVWHHVLDKEYILKLIRSMPSRIQAVIKARGGVTKY